MRAVRRRPLSHPDRPGLRPEPVQYDPQRRARTGSWNLAERDAARENVLCAWLGRRLRFIGAALTERGRGRGGFSPRRGADATRALDRSVRDAGRALRLGRERRRVRLLPLSPRALRAIRHRASEAQRPAGHGGHVLGRRVERRGPEREAPLARGGGSPRHRASAVSRPHHALPRHHRARHTDGHPCVLRVPDAVRRQRVRNRQSHRPDRSQRPHPWRRKHATRLPESDHDADRHWPAARHCARRKCKSAAERAGFPSGRTLHRLEADRDLPLSAPT